MNAMISKYLKDFSIPALSEAAGPDVLDSLAGTPFGDFEFGAEPAQEIDIEAEKHDAYGKGFKPLAKRRTRGMKKNFAPWRSSMPSRSGTSLPHTSRK